MGIFSRNKEKNNSATPVQKNTRPIPYYYSSYNYQWRPEEYYVKRDYYSLARQCYISNPIFHRCVNEIANAFSQIPLILRSTDDSIQYEHPILSLLEGPAPGVSGEKFRFDMMCYYLMSGNIYIESLGLVNRAPERLRMYRPDHIILNQKQSPWQYEYQIEHNRVLTRWAVDMDTGLAQTGDFYHIRNFNPLDQWRGVGPAEAAAYPSDNFNLMMVWNKKTLENAASSSLILTNDAQLDPKEFQEAVERIRELSEMHNKAAPLVLDGGFEIEDLSKNAKDVEWLEGMVAMARHICQAFGVPTQLVNIPGDNSYQSSKEARQAFTQNTLEPLIKLIVSGLNTFLAPKFGLTDRYLDVDWDQLSALYPQRQMKYEMLEKVSYLTVNEKRVEAGFQPLPASDPRGNMLTHELKQAPVEGDPINTGGEDNADT